MYTFIDLFAGIGGMRLAFESAGCKCIFSSEWNKFSQQTYKENFGETPNGDITKVDVDIIPNHHILIGGFPCQPFSMAGNELGFKDTRGTLFFEIVKIAKQKRPDAMLLEKCKEHNTSRKRTNIQGHPSRIRRTWI